MAAEATHVVLTELIFNEFFAHFSKPDFIVGTLFPDIRYLGVIDRTKTHIHDVHLERVVRERDPFLAGLKFHSLIDHVRENFILDQGMYAYCPDFKYITQSIKLLEDERYYPKIDSWKEKISYLAVPHDAEKRYGILDTAIEKWHLLLREYFSGVPTDRSRKNFMTSMGFGDDIADSINDCVAVLREKADVVRIIDDFIDFFPELIKR